MESFYKTLKREMPVIGKFESRLDARQEIFKFIELYYNTRRSHSTIGNMSPVEYERLFEQKSILRVRILDTIQINNRF